MTSQLPGVIMQQVIQTVHWSQSIAISVSLDGAWRDQLAQTLASIRIPLSQVC